MLNGPEGHRRALAREQERFARLLTAAGERGALGARVPGCPAWSVGDLAAHLTAVHRWAAASTRRSPAGPLPPERGGPGATDAGAADPGAADPAAAYAAAAAELRRALAVPPATPCRTLHGRGVVADWSRRQLHETLVHRWDLQDALGPPGTADPADTDPVDVEAVDVEAGDAEAVAADCVAEVVEALLPRQVRLGRVPAPAAGVLLLAPRRRWVLGEPRRVVAEVAGPAQVLARLLWRRTGPDDPRLRVTGDRAAAAALLGAALTP
ncbi:maleylpyruvate isomerase family mycothiol-dependent enzyme [Kineococcus gypseus]|uniref:maleylpyruvate isomerase family mycothiol-dependent enzyme n=1 Tax=Kineococcus gypseus TaxID=1637102 RepID=UPI003D7EF6DC